MNNCAFPALAAVTEDGRAAGKNLGGGRHGDQVRRFEENVWELLTPEAYEQEAAAATKEQFKDLVLRLRPVAVVFT